MIGPNLPFGGLACGLVLGPLPSLWLLEEVGELDLEDWELCSLTTTSPFTIIVILVGQLAVVCPKPKHLKHFLLEVLVGDLGVEVEGWSLETL